VRPYRAWFRIEQVRPAWWGDDGMALIRRAAGSGTTITVLTFGLMANLAPIATFAAVMPEITANWGLTASQAGWIGDVYFGGYAACVPILAGATDKIDARWVFVGCSLLGALANFTFASAADGFWMALVLRFLSGAGLAGVHMPGLKLLADRVPGRVGARGAAIYTSSYALGSAGSFFLTGIVDTAFGWRASFTASGIAPLLAIAALTLLPAATQPRRDAAVALDFRPVLRDRALMAYVLAFAGNIWEVSAVRAWFVVYLAWTLSLPGNELPLPALAVISGLASLVGFPVAIGVAELTLRYGKRVIVATCLISVLVCLALAVTAGGPTLLVLPLLVLVQITSIADAGALSSGAVATADPARRGTALAAYAFIGYTAAFAGPVAVGTALDLFGGIGDVMGWTAAFVQWRSARPRPHGRCAARALIRQPSNGDLRQRPPPRCGWASAAPGQRFGRLRASANPRRRRSVRRQPLATRLPTARAACRLATAHAARLCGRHGRAEFQAWYCPSADRS